ncbi:MAG: MFS transporter [Pseudomonadota bacterium]
MRPRAAIAALAVSQTLVWAALFYSFPALLLVWEAEAGWTRSGLTLAFTLAILAAAIASPLAGRLVDRGNGRAVMAGATAVGASALAALSQVQSLAVFTLLWAVIGLAMGGCLYETCFAVVTRTGGTAAARRITAITLVAGFASTLAFPAATGLAAALGWRATVLIAAAVTLTIALPLLIWAIGCLERAAPPVPARDKRALPSPKAWERRAFWLLFLGFPCLALNHGILITHLLPLLAERGVPDARAVLAVSLIGPMQVAGRLVMLALQRRASPLTLALGASASIAAASVVLALAGGWLAALLVFALLQGGAVGMTSILRPVIAAQIFGRAAFGAVSGLLAAPYIAASAAAPFAGALIWGLGGYDLLLGLTATAGLGAFALLAGLHRQPAGPAQG